MVLIKGLQKTTLVDYPGKVACTVFTAGCNFRCPFCHNPDLIEKKRHDKLATISEKDFFDFLGQRGKWIDGVVITGGEPCIYKDLPEFMMKIKAKGLLVKLDTNGSNPSMLRKIIEEKLADFIAMDIKSTLDLYDISAGAKVEKDKLEKSIQLVKDAEKKGIDYEFRLTAVPALHTRDEIKRIGEMLKGSKKIAIQQFENKNTYDTSYQDVKPFSRQELEYFENMLEPYFDEVELRVY